MCARSATCVTVSYVCVYYTHGRAAFIDSSLLFCFIFFFFRLFCFYLGGETRHLPPDGWEEWAKGLNQHPRALTWVWSRSRSSSSSNNNSDSNHGTWSNHMPTTKHTKVASSPCRRIICRLFFVYWEKNKTQIIFISFGLFFFFLLFYRITKGIENYTNIYHNCVYVLFGVWFLFKLRAPRLIGLAFCIWRNTSRVACDFKLGKLRYVFVMMGHVLEKIKK